MKRRANTPEDIAEMLGVALKGVGGPSGVGKIMAVSTRKDLAGDLRAFGEDAIAEKVMALSDEQFKAVYERAGVLYLVEKNIVRALCLAAVERVDGKPRELSRKRRKNAT